MVLDFPKYCYMRFRPSPFVLKCVCYFLVFESGPNIIGGGGGGHSKGSTNLSIKHCRLNFVMAQCHILNYEILIP